MKTFHRAFVAGGALALIAALTPAGARAQRSGVEIWAQTCGNCHRAQPATRYSATDWQRLSMHMTITARLPDDDHDAVLQFLKGGARRVASTAPASPANPNPTLLASADPTRFFPSARIDSVETFENLCVACHGAHGAGDGPVAAALSPRPTNLTDPELQDGRTDAELADAVRDGIRTMPGFGNQLTDGDVEAMVEYIRSLRKQDR